MTPHALPSLRHWLFGPRHRLRPPSGRCSGQRQAADGVSGGTRSPVAGRTPLPASVDTATPACGSQQVTRGQSACPAACLMHGDHRWAITRLLGVVLSACFCPRAQPSKRDSRHACPRNLAHVKWLIEKLVEPGEMIPAPLTGCGVTDIAALRRARRLRGMESDPRRFAEAVERLREEYAPETARPAARAQPW
jgi:hypothetical protein